MGQLLYPLAISDRSPRRSRTPGAAKRAPGKCGRPVAIAACRRHVVVNRAGSRRKARGSQSGTPAATTHCTWPRNALDECTLQTTILLCTNKVSPARARTRPRASTAWAQWRNIATRLEGSAYTNFRPSSHSRHAAFQQQMRDVVAQRARPALGRATLAASGRRSSPPVARNLRAHRAGTIRSLATRGQLAPSHETKGWTPSCLTATAHDSSPGKHACAIGRRLTKAHLGVCNTRRVTASRIPLPLAGRLPGPASKRSQPTATARSHSAQAGEPPTLAYDEPPTRVGTWNPMCAILCCSCAGIRWTPPADLPLNDSAPLPAGQASGRPAPLRSEGPGDHPAKGDRVPQPNALALHTAPAPVLSLGSVPAAHARCVSLAARNDSLSRLCATPARRPAVPTPLRSELLPLCERWPPTSG